MPPTTRLFTKQQQDHKEEEGRTDDRVVAEEEEEVEHESMKLLVQFIWLRARTESQVSMGENNRAKSKAKNIQKRRDVDRLLGRYSVYLLYWYKSTSTDEAEAEGGGAAEKAEWWRVRERKERTRKSPKKKMERCGIGTPV